MQRASQTSARVEARCPTIIRDYSAGSSGLFWWLRRWRKRSVCSTIIPEWFCPSGESDGSQYFVACRSDDWGRDHPNYRRHSIRAGDRRDQLVLPNVLRLDGDSCAKEWARRTGPSGGIGLWLKRRRNNGYRAQRWLAEQCERHCYRQCQHNLFSRFSCAASGQHSGLYNSEISTRWLVITFGTDTSLTTRPGWDNVTGVGTPNGLAFINAIAP